MPFTWLHISDLHVRRDAAYEREVVFRSLVQSVEWLRKERQRAPDLIFATGDIAQSGQTEEYAEATRFFDNLLRASGLDRSRLYVVPGNHDVDRRQGRWLLRELSSITEADEYFGPDTPKPHLTSKMSAFLQWHRDYFEGIRSFPENSTCGPVEVVQLNGHSLGILPINTALFCLNDEDHEKLFVGRRCLDTAIDDLNRSAANLKVALMHHPLEDLSGLERQHIRAGLADNVDVILQGHLHEQGFVATGMWSLRNIWSRAGATYQSRLEWPNTASYATFDGEHITIFPIRYERQPRPVWTVDPSQFPESESHEWRFRLPSISGRHGPEVMGWDPSKAAPGG